MSAVPTHALVLAAGRGERMRPLTDVTPKPLLHAGGKRLIEWQIESLAAAGVRTVVVNTAHFPEQFEAALGDGDRYGVTLQYSCEGSQAGDALETLGGIVYALDRLGDAPFIVTSGDIVTHFPYQRLARASDALQRGAFDAHLVLVDNPPFHPQGDMGLVEPEPNDIETIDATQRRIDPDAAPRLTYANIGVFAPRLFEPLADELKGHRAALFPWIYTAARAQRVSGERFDGHWWNVGTPDDLERLNAELSIGSDREPNRESA